MSELKSIVIAATEEKVFDQPIIPRFSWVQDGAGKPIAIQYTIGMYRVGKEGVETAPEGTEKVCGLSLTVDELQDDPELNRAIEVMYSRLLTYTEK